MTPTGARPVIVLADDDPAVAALVAETLRADIAAEVIVVENGALVVDAVVDSGAALLILDISMPGASGIDVYDILRNHAAIGATPVLFMTAEPERGLATLDRSGTRDVIAKPFDLDDLVRRVRALLADDVRGDVMGRSSNSSAVGQDETAPQDPQDPQDP